MAVGPVQTQNNNAEEARQAAERRREEQRRAQERKRVEEQKRAEQQRKAEQAKRAQEQARARQDKIKDRAKVSPEARQKGEAQKKEDTFQKHLRALEDNFKNVDDKGQDDQDGTVSRDDIKGVSSGDYDRDQARERLIDDGFSSKKADQQIARMEEAAQYFDQNEKEWDRVESAGSSEGKTDDKLTRQDFDKLTTERQTKELDAKQKDLEAGKIGGPSTAKVRQSYAKFDTAKELNKALDKNGDLSTYSEADRRALAARASQDPEAAARLKEVATDSVMNADSLDDLKGLGMQHLVKEGVVGNDEATEKLKKLAASKVENVIDNRLDGRQGDQQAEGGIERVQQDVRALALENPVLAKEIAAAAQKDMGGRADQIEDIKRGDDGFFQDIGNGIKDGTKLAGDGVRGLAEVATKLDILPHNMATNALKLGGKALGVVGADGLGDKVSGLGEFVDKQNDNFLKGAAEGAAGTVEGFGQIVRNPIETAKGVAELVKDPSLLLDSYKKTLEEHGVAGLLGQAAFEVLGTKGAGAALKKVGEIGTVANGLDKLDNVAAVQRLKAVDTKIDDLKTAGFEKLDSMVAGGVDSNPKLRAGVDGAGEVVDVLAGKLSDVKQAAAARLRPLLGHQIISAQQGAPSPSVPVSQRVAAQVDQYGSSAGDAAEAREDEQQLSINSVFKSLLKSILGATV